MCVLYLCTIVWELYFYPNRCVLVVCILGCGITVHVLCLCTCGGCVDVPAHAFVYCTSVVFVLEGDFPLSRTRVRPSGDCCHTKQGHCGG